MASAPRPTDHADVPGRAFVPALLAIGLVVSVISSLGAPLIPEIARSMHASLGATQWSLTATLLVGAVVSPLLGRLGDGPQRRRVLVGGLAVVTVGGAVAALARTLPLLVAGRGLQGVGLALMPLTMAAARDHLPRPRATATIATLSVTGAAGVGLGYPITGLIAERLGVSAAFWAGAAASGVALLAGALFVPRPSPRARAEPLDVLGAVLVGAGVLCLLLALEKGGAWGWLAPATLGLLAAAVVLLAVWTRHELATAHPLVELRLVRHRAVLTANLSGLVLGVAMYLGISLVTQIVQLPGGMDGSVFLAGLTLLPLSVLSVASSRLEPAVRERLGQRAVIPLGSLAIAVALLFLAATGDAVWQAFATMGIVGLGLGFTFAAMPGLIVGSVPPDETSSAMSFYQVTRYVGFSIGSGLAITLLSAFAPGGAPTTGAYGRTLLVGSALCVGAAAVAWVVPRLPAAGRDDDDGEEAAIEEGELGAAGLPRLEEW